MAWLVLRTFPVHLGLPSLLVLLLTDPPTKQNVRFLPTNKRQISHLLERPERGEDGSSYPGSVSSLLGSVGRNQFEPHGGGCLDTEVSVQPLVKTVEAGVTFS